MELATIISLTVPLVAAAAAYGGSKQALNGTKERVKKLEAKEDTRDAQHVETVQRLTSIETKVDAMIDNQRGMH